MTKRKNNSPDNRRVRPRASAKTDSEVDQLEEEWGGIGPVAQEQPEMGGDGMESEEEGGPEEEATGSEPEEGMDDPVDSSSSEGEHEEVIRHAGKDVGEWVRSGRYRPSQGTYSPTLRFVY
jgi:hypothetical protein